MKEKKKKKKREGRERGRRWGGRPFLSKRIPFADLIRKALLSLRYRSSLKLAMTTDFALQYPSLIYFVLPS